MEYKCNVKVVDRTSKNGNVYTVAEIYLGDVLVKGGIFLSDAEKSLFTILGSK